MHFAFFTKRIARVALIDGARVATPQSVVSAHRCQSEVFRARGRRGKPVVVAPLMTSDKDAPATPRGRRDARGARRRLNFGAEAPVADVPEAPDERLEARRRWNFDFEHELPLDGDWEWERVVASTDEARQAEASQAEAKGVATPDDESRRV